MVFYKAIAMKGDPVFSLNDISYFLYDVMISFIYYLYPLIVSECPRCLCCMFLRTCGLYIPIKAEWHACTHGCFLC